jgi:hypothetical protein
MKIKNHNKNINLSSIIHLTKLDLIFLQNIVEIYDELNDTEKRFLSLILQNIHMQDYDSLLQFAPPSFFNPIYDSKIP